MRPKRFIVAHSRIQFLDWCRRNKVRPSDSREVLHVSDGQMLRGYSRVNQNDVIFLPGSWNHPRYEEIMSAVRAMISKGKT